MKVTIKHWMKGRLERFYFNNADTGETVGYIAISGGEYNAKDDSCAPVNFDYHGNADMIEKTIAAAKEVFKKAGFLHNSDGTLEVSGDSFLMFSAENGAKNVIVTRGKDIYKKIKKVYEVTE